MIGASKQIPFFYSPTVRQIAVADFSVGLTDDLDLTAHGNAVLRSRICEAGRGATSATSTCAQDE